MKLGRDEKHVGFEQRWFNESKTNLGYEASKKLCPDDI